MRTHIANTFQAVHRTSLSKQIRKIRCVRSALAPPILAIRVYILPQKHNFFNTRSSQTAQLCHNCRKIPAAFTTAYIGYNTIRAKIIATINNVYLSHKTTLLPARQFIWKITVILRNIYNWPFTSQNSGNILRQTVLLIGSQYNIQMPALPLQ